VREGGAAAALGVLGLGDAGEEPSRRGFTAAPRAGPAGARSTAAPPSRASPRHGCGRERDRRRRTRV